MDTISHAVTGALLARAVTADSAGNRQPAPHGVMLAGAAGAVFPDLDFGLRLIDTLTYLNWHQGPTHSLALLPLWGLLVAWLVALAGRKRYRWQAFYIPACLGIAIHIAGDALTAYGPMLFSPVSDQRYFTPWLYLLDPVFSAIAVAGLAAVLILPGGRHAAVTTLLLLIIYIGWQGMLHAQALRAGADYAQARSIDVDGIHALPQPFSPFNWMLLLSQPGGYDRAMINLHRSQPDQSSGNGLLQRMQAAYEPVATATWRHHERFGDQSSRTSLARAAWQDPAFAPFRRFAMFPILERVEETDRGVCAWFADLRFALPAVPTSYRFGLCRQGDGSDWQLKRQRGAFWLD